MHHPVGSKCLRAEGAWCLSGLENVMYTNLYDGVTSIEDNGVASLKDYGVALLKDDGVSEKMRMLTSDVLNGAKRPNLEEITPPVDGSENAQDVHAGRQEVKNTTIYAKA